MREFAGKQQASADKPRNGIAMSHVRSQCSQFAADSLKVAILTGGIDPHYAAGLSNALAAQQVTMDIVIGAGMDFCNLVASPNAALIPLYGPSQPDQSRAQKFVNCLRVYGRLLRYAAASSPRVFHILWNYKLPFFDRTVLMLCFKALGKRIVFTAHNVNSAERDGCDSVINRLTLWIQYYLADHIFVHTDKMQQQLTTDFGVPPRKISIIPFGVYDRIPRSTMTPDEARSRLGLQPSDYVLLFFGRIVRYKGLHHLVEAFERLATRDSRYKLIIAGDPMKDVDHYWVRLKDRVEMLVSRNRCVPSIGFVPDHEIEIYFKAADVLVLPYTHIFQSGPLFMAYGFGLPVVAADVGSFSRDIISGTTGYLCAPADSVSLATAIDRYFVSDLYRNLSEMRPLIQELAHSSHSWDIVSTRTKAVYSALSA